MDNLIEHADCQEAADAIERLQSERDEAVRFIGVVNEELVLRGFRGGDRSVILANLRGLAHLASGAPVSLSADSPEMAVAGYVMVPVEPPTSMWGGLARDLIMWRDMQQPTGIALYKHLSNCGRDIPGWLFDEIPNTDHVPPKGTVAVCIYKAMLAAAPKP